MLQPTCINQPQELRERIIEKAVNDADFRERLLDDPNAAVGEELGVAIPDTLTIHVHEEDVGDAHLVLPPTSKLSPEELQTAAAGSDVWKIFFPASW